MTTGNAAFQLVDERGWRRGLNNLLRGEFSSWFKSRKWWGHLLIWLLIINLILFFTVIGTREAAKTGEEAEDTIMLYGIFGGLFVGIGVMIIMQGAIVGEKQSGTAAWVLSKPVTRTAFVVSRLVGNSVGVLLTAVLLPGVVAYVTFGALSPLGWLPPLDFFAGVAALALHMLFWLTLTLMAGTFFESAGGVIAIPLVLLFGQWFLGGVIPGLIYIAPLLLALGPGDEYPALAWSFINGEAPFSWIPLIATVFFCILFTGVAIWRFNRQEF